MKRDKESRLGKIALDGPGAKMDGERRQEGIQKESRQIGRRGGSRTKGVERHKSEMKGEGWTRRRVRGSGDDERGRKKDLLKASPAKVSRSLLASTRLWASNVAFCARQSPTHARKAAASKALFPIITSLLMLLEIYSALIKTRTS